MRISHIDLHWLIHNLIEVLKANNNGASPTPEFNLIVRNIGSVRSINF